MTMEHPMKADMLEASHQALTDTLKRAKELLSCLPSSAYADSYATEFIEEVNALIADSEKLMAERNSVTSIQKQLRPCPHCDGKAYEGHGLTTVFFGGTPQTPGHFKIKCYACSASVERSTIEKAIAIWNLRHS